MAFTTYVVYYEWNSGKIDRDLIERYSITDLREYLIKDLKHLKHLKRIHILYNRQKEIMWRDNSNYYTLRETSNKVYKVNTDGTLVR